MGPLVVPMNPEFLPEGMLLVAALFTGVAAVGFLLARKRGRALQAGAASLACAAAALVMVNTLHEPPGPPRLTPAGESTMSLVLGDVVLRVAPAKRYVLTVEGRRFLELDVQASGLAASGMVGAASGAAATVRDNTFPVSRNGIRPARDAHTLLAQDQGRDVFRVRYAEPFRIEVDGHFFDRRSAPALISLEKGIRWPGGGLPPGAVLDLTRAGAGTIDFTRTGRVRVVPRAGAA